jgi:very-short-patch-repair endonuclease
MLNKQVLAVISELARGSFGVFHVRDALARGVSRKQLSTLLAAAALTRELPGVYRLAAVPRSHEQALTAALLWGGIESAAYGRSAGEVYRLEGVLAPRPEIVVPHRHSMKAAGVVMHRAQTNASLMLRTHRGVRVTGVEATLVALAYALDGEAFEIACEDARRRRLTTVSALRAYIDRFGRRGLHGVRATRALLAELDPVAASRSTLEVKTRRLLVANGFTDFEREFPLAWNGRVYRYDFAFRAPRTILETNGRRWHDDPTDYEADNEKWSVPARHGWRIVFATWDKVARRPHSLLAELAAAAAA